MLSAIVGAHGGAARLGAERKHIPAFMTLFRVGVERTAHTKAVLSPQFLILVLT